MTNSKFTDGRFLALSLTSEEVVKKAGDGELIRDADLRNHDYTNKDLRKGRFVRCLMQHSIFEGADLSGVSFTGCDLRYMTVNERTVLKGARFIDCDMRDLYSKGLYDRLYPDEIELCDTSLTQFDAEFYDWRREKIKHARRESMDLIGMLIDLRIAVAKHSDQLEKVDDIINAYCEESPDENK